MNLNSDSDDSDSMPESEPPAELVVGTRLLVRWESGWESGAVGERVTPAMGGRSVDGVTPTTLYRVDYDDGESCLHDLTTILYRVQIETSAVAAEAAEVGGSTRGAARGELQASDDNGEADTWAQCERCDKWRKLSSGRALPEHWFCELNPNRAFASCQIAEEQYEHYWGNEEQEVVGRVVDDEEAVEVEAVWETVEEQASSQTELGPSTAGGFEPSGLAALVAVAGEHALMARPCDRPPRGTNGLPMQCTGLRWVEKKRKRADGDGEVQPKAKKGPKKGRSAYNFFSMEQRKSGKLSALTFAEAGKAIGEKYRTAARTRPYEQRLVTYSPPPRGPQVEGGLG